MDVRELKPGYRSRCRWPTFAVTLTIGLLLGLCVTSCTDFIEPPDVRPAPLSGSWTLESVRGDTLPVTFARSINNQINTFGAKVTFYDTETILYSDAVLEWIDDVLYNRSQQLTFRYIARESSAGKLMLHYTRNDSTFWMAFLHRPDNTLDRADASWQPYGELWRRVIQ